jgi:hypothetical protein
MEALVKPLLEVLSMRGEFRVCYSNLLESKLISPGRDEIREFPKKVIFHP